jgi:hypothetical protein
MSVMRNRDVYPRSGILIFVMSSRIYDPGSRIPDPGSRIQQHQQKRREIKVCCPTLICCHIYDKIESRFSFEQVKKKI